ncbi:MAG TPA: hypothetical protein VE177_03895 [Candidatus Binatus sp.]|nr:hypothetical protein [Candidatus Binatus sp.]
MLLLNLRKNIAVKATIAKGGSTLAMNALSAWSNVPLTAFEDLTLTIEASIVTW